jgi:hypothetical protein
MDPKLQALIEAMRWARHAVRAMLMKVLLRVARGDPLPPQENSNQAGDGGMS